jgi:hypothetical protein
MGYAHIDNLYKNKELLIFKEVYAMEKIHGTSTHITYKDDQLHFFSGGCKHEQFVQIFNQDELLEKFRAAGIPEITIFGEGYGGKMQGMSKVYGPNLKFVAFEVKTDGWWNVPYARHFVEDKLGLEFVYFNKVPATVEALDGERDAPSEQAKRNGVLEPQIREGIVIRPPVEFALKNGGKLRAKHKRAEFIETSKERKVSTEKLEILEKATEIANDWTTPMRLSHVLDKLPHGIGIESAKLVISKMQEDILREAEGEIVVSPQALKEIAKVTVALFKKHLNEEIRNG